MKSRIGIELTESETKNILSKSELESFGDEKYRMGLALAEVSCNERERVANGSPNKFYEKFRHRVKSVYNKNRVIPIIVMCILAIMYMLLVPQEFKSGFAGTAQHFQSVFVVVSICIMSVKARHRFHVEDIEDYGQNLFDIQRDKLEKKSVSRKVKVNLYVALIIFFISSGVTYLSIIFPKMIGSIVDTILAWTITINFAAMGLLVNAEMLYVRFGADEINLEDLKYSAGNILCPNCGHLYSFFTSDIGKHEYTSEHYQQKEVVNGREVTVGGIYADGKRVGDLKESIPGYRVYDKVVEKYKNTTHVCAHCGYKKFGRKTTSSKREGEYIGKL